MFNPNDHLIKLKGGKMYLPVAKRLVWFREQHADWCINTQIVENDAEHAIFRATICDDGGAEKNTGHGSETKRDFPDFFEKAETKAVGRALAMLGYGTQFTGDEFDEGERLADAPIEPQRGAETNVTGVQADSPTEAQRGAETRRSDNVKCERCGAIITGIRLPDGKTMTAQEVVGRSKLANSGACYCYNCSLAAKRERGKKVSGQ